MKREKMNRIIKFEMGYIPNGSTGSVQNKLRYYYNVFRRKGIVKGMSRGECLKNAINRLKKDYTACNPKFDKEFFKMPKKPLSVKQVIKRFLARMHKTHS